MPVTHCEPALEQCGIPWNSCLIKHHCKHNFYIFLQKKITDKLRRFFFFGFTLRKKCSINELEILLDILKLVNIQIINVLFEGKQCKRYEWSHDIQYSAMSITYFAIIKTWSCSSSLSPSGVSNSAGTACDLLRPAAANLIWKHCMSIRQVIFMDFIWFELIWYAMICLCALPRLLCRLQL